MKTNNFPVWVWISVLATAILAFLNLLPRIQAEESNKAVGIAIELAAVEQVAGATVPIEDALAKLRESGANILLLNEQTVGELENEGKLTLTSYAWNSTTVGGREAELQRLTDLAEATFASEESESLYPREDYAVPPEVFRALPIGIDPEDVLIGNLHDFELAGRYFNRTDHQEWPIEQAKKYGLTGYLPIGDSVLGFPKDLPAIQDQLDQAGILYYSAEFANIFGDSAMRAKTPGNTLRLHAAQTAELSQISLSAAVERYAKAARERNSRVLLVRPQYSSTDIDGFAEFILLIKREVVKDGGDVKSPRPFQLFQPNALLAGLLGLAMVPVFFAVATSLIPQPRFRTLLAILAALPGVVAFVPSLKFATALAGSIAFVILGYLWLFKHRDLGLIWQYLGVSALSIVGGLQVPGLLLGTPYMLQAGQFTGVKLSVFLPILIVGLILLNTVRPLKELAKDPIYWGTAVAALVGLAALMFMNSRTGNDNPAGVSGLELQVRNLLDQILPVRPRTKEFLIGHPAFIIGLGFWGIGRQSEKTAHFGILCLAISVIGQTSIVNTLCHLHTPVLLSLLRIGSGLLAGGIFGLLGWMALRAITVRTLTQQETA